MKKLNPNIIRVEDKVKILNPEIFIRCGYPLTPADLYEEVAKQYGEKINAFVRETLGFPPKQISTTEEEIDYDFYYDSREAGTLENKILEAFCYYSVKMKGFGGKERKIYTETSKSYQDKIGIVEKIKFHKTGIYTPGRGPGYSAYEPDDYDPPYLSNEKTHKILKLKFPYGYKEYLSPVQIESIHVKKEI